MNIINEPTSPYSLTPISAKSVKLLRSPRKASRKISKIPFKVLDAPELQVIVLLNFLNRAQIHLRIHIQNLKLYKINDKNLKLVSQVDSLWGDCMFIPADWGSYQQICAIFLFLKTFHYKNDQMCKSISIFFLKNNNIYLFIYSYFIKIKLQA